MSLIFFVKISIGAYPTAKIKTIWVNLFIGLTILRGDKPPDNGMLVVCIAYCDFNNDGYVDIIGMDENSPNNIKLYTNDGNEYYTSSILNIDNDSENGFFGAWNKKQNYLKYEKTFKS